MQYPHARLLMFAKAPLPGQVKTRMIPTLGAAGAARLQAGLIRAMSARFADIGLCPLELWAAPGTDHPLFRELAGRYPVRVHAQCGADLGERMRRAAADALTRAESVVLVGSDCPALTPAYLARALALLQQADAVLGPAEDGGYVLLALKQAAGELFEAMPWGTDRVADLTRRRLDRLGWRWAELPTLWDLDRPADLERARGLPGVGDWLPGAAAKS